jgi:HNH endonuclease
MVEPYEVPYPFVVRRDGSIKSTRRLRKRGSIGVQVALDGFTVIPSEEDGGTLFVNFSLSHGHRQYVHRLVAEKFIPNPESYEYILFKDGNVKNCNVDNLEWCE